LTAADGVELAYWLDRPSVESGRLLVLLHGVASNHTRWSEFVERTGLTERWSVLRPDLRGNGDSMSRSGQNVAAWGDDLLRILTAEGFSSAVFVGHSLGAQIAIHLAHQAAGATDGLVLIDPVFHRALRGRPLLWYRNRWLIRLAAWKVMALNALGLRRREFPGRDIRLLDEETRQALRGDASFESIARKYSAWLPILEHMPTANYLHQVLATLGELPSLEEIDVPVLALLSGGVSFADLEVNREEIARFPRSETVILDANHWPLTEAPDETRQAIEEWVARVHPRLA